MKKVLFLTILPFLLLGTANVSAQVRIGGSGTPHNAAVLDLNADNETTPTGNRGGLALPRVELATVTMQLNNTAPINGMLVYNTGGTLATGVYVWMTDKWVETSTGSVAYTGSASIALDNGSFQREELTGDVTADKNSNQTTIGTGTVTSDKILDQTITATDIADNAVGSLQLANGAVTGAKLAASSVGTANLADSSVNAAKLQPMGASTGDALVFGGTTWAPTALPGTLGAAGGGRFVLITRAAGKSFDTPGTGQYLAVACRGAGQTIFRPLGTIALGGTGVVIDSGGTTLCNDKTECACFFRTF
jgi:hypothetical protein